MVSSWLMGEEPPAFDLLSWNNDSTRMPAEMHTFYLRSCYVENQLARGVMELAGQRLDIAKVDQDLYFLSAEQDHIAPWRSSYAGARLPAGDVRFVLSNSGHIAGIVNPPGPSLCIAWSRPASCPPNPDDWLGRRRPTPGPGGRTGPSGSPPGRANAEAAADGQSKVPADRRRAGHVRAGGLRVPGRLRRVQGRRHRRGAGHRRRHRPSAGPGGADRVPPRCPGRAGRRHRGQDRRRRRRRTCSVLSL